VQILRVYTDGIYHRQWQVGGTGAVAINEATGKIAWQDCRTVYSCSSRFVSQYQALITALWLIQRRKPTGAHIRLCLDSAELYDAVFFPHQWPRYKTLFGHLRWICIRLEQHYQADITFARIESYENRRARRLAYQGALRACREQ
jgi:ribonuclease HI